MRLGLFDTESKAGSCALGGGGVAPPAAAFHWSSHPFAPEYWDTHRVSLAAEANVSSRAAATHTHTLLTPRSLSLADWKVANQPASPLTKTTPLSFSFTEKRKEQPTCAHRALFTLSVFIHGNKQNWIFCARAMLEIYCCWFWLVPLDGREMSFKLVALPASFTFCNNFDGELLMSMVLIFVQHVSNWVNRISNYYE